MKLTDMALIIIALAAALTACQNVETPPEKLKIDLTEGALEYTITHTEDDVCLGYNYEQEVGKLSKINVGFDAGYYIEWTTVEQVDGCNSNGDPTCFTNKPLRRMTIGKAKADHIQELVADIPAYAEGDTCPSTRCAHVSISLPSVSNVLKQTEGCADGGVDYAEKVAKLVDYLKETVPGTN